MISGAFTVGNPFKGKLDGSYFDPENSYNLNKYFDKAHGDQFVFLNIFSNWLKLKRSNYNQMRKWCNKNGIIERRFYEVVQLCSQFEKIVFSKCLLLNRTQRHDNLKERDKTTILNKSQKLDLEKLKKSIINAKPKKRKILSHDDSDYEANDITSNDHNNVKSSYSSKNHNNNNKINYLDKIQKLENITDVKEIEFRLLNSGQSISDCLYQNLSETDILLIKFVITCGLYPHIAIPDEVNSVRRDSETYFHIKEKQFVSLHPTSCFSYKPTILSNLMSKNKTPFVILYGSLLETTKQYLVDNFHVPALYTLLLVANSVDTDATCSRIVVDNWLEFEFPVFYYFYELVYE